MIAAAIRTTTRIRARAKQLLVAAIVVASMLRTLDAQANWRDDLTLWERAIDSNPDSGDSWSMYVQALEDAGATDAALVALEQGLARASSPRLVMRKANLLIARGQRAAGLVAMREAAEANEPRAMANLALLLEEDGKRAEALAWARRADGVPIAHTHRVHGKIALASGLGPEALEAFTAAYGLEPHNAQNQYNLALALIAVQRPNDALPYLVRCAKAPETTVVCRAQLANYQRRQ
jgi:tetratricopeptide (TPR) repeat protein